MCKTARDTVVPASSIGSNIAVGDIIAVHKAGDIIPEVLKVVEHSGNDIFKMPENCPSCGEVLVQELGKVALKCVNINCPTQLERAIIHFCSRTAMDIEGMGEAVVSRLISNGLISSVEDIYKLSAENLLTLEGFANKKAENLIFAIEKSKQNDLYKLIFALGIAGVGEKAAKQLSAEFRSMEKLCLASAEDIIAIDGFGQKLASAICDYFSDERNLELIKHLSEFGVNMISLSEDEKASDIFLGKTFVITGTLQNMTRSEASDIIEKNGGKVSSSVSKKTSYLLAGEDAGIKYDKALALGVEIIDEAKFLEMLA